MNFLRDPQYNAIKVILILLVIVGAAYFIISNINSSFSGVARVADSDSGNSRESASGGTRTPNAGGGSSSGRPRSGSGTTSSGPKQSTVSTIIENIFNGSDSIQSTNPTSLGTTLPTTPDEKVTNIVGTTTTNFITIPNLTPGTHTFSVVATDGNGNSSAESSPITVVIDGTSTGDNTAPTLTSIVTGVSQTSATITWETNEVASSIVEYGQTTSYGNSTTEIDTAPFVTNHSVTLTGLSAEMLYHFRVKSYDVAHNLGTSSDYTFTTQSLPTPPTTPVIISSNPSSGSNNNTPKILGSAPAGTTVKLYTASSCSSGSLAVSGSASTFTNSGLVVTVADNTATTFYATATDAQANVSACSSGYTYSEKTPPTPDTTDPVISNINIAVTDSSAGISWITDEAASSRVDYGLTSGYGSTSGTINTNPRVTSHSITLSGLTSATTYHMSVTSTDGSNNTATSGDLTFTTGTLTTYQCADGFDNDGDSLTDLNDPGCSSSSDDSEFNEVTSGPVQISNGGSSSSNNNQNTQHCSVYGSPLTLIKYWSKGTDAMGVQKAINQMQAANPPLVTDGIIGPKSLLGIKTVQSILGTKTDGLWGQITQGLYATWAQQVCQD